MKFELKKSKLLFEMRYKSPNSKECYTYEMLYKTICGKYFIHFEAEKYSEYSVEIGMFDYMARSGNYWIDEVDINMWKEMSLRNCTNKPERYMVIDWEKEENESIFEEIKHNNQLMMMGTLPEGELPF